MSLIRTLSRRHLRTRPFPVPWRDILNDVVPFYRRLGARYVADFEVSLQVFEHEKAFVGAGGFEITEEVRVVISAAAVRLVVGLDIAYFDRLHEIVVYPAAFVHPDRKGGLLGQVDDWNIVVLSWEDVLAGLRNPRDGRDTALHEFAHVLDRATGVFDGTPTLRASGDYGPWGQILSEHFARLCENDPNELAVLGRYAATNEAEFFAVATEVYFERPKVMRRRAPDLYEVLRRFYGFDPAVELTEGD